MSEVFEGQPVVRLSSVANAWDVTLRTVQRWVNPGVRGRDGAVVRLGVVKVGAVIRTSPEEVAKFVRRLGNPPMPEGMTGELDPDQGDDE